MKKKIEKTDADINGIKRHARNTEMVNILWICIIEFRAKSAFI